MKKVLFVRASSSSKDFRTGLGQVISSLHFWLWFEYSFLLPSLQPETRVLIWVKGNPHACTNTTITKQLSSFLVDFFNWVQLSAPVHGLPTALSAGLGLGSLGSSHPPQSRSSQNQSCPRDADTEAEPVAYCCCGRGLVFLLSTDSTLPPPLYWFWLVFCWVSQPPQGNSTNLRDCACCSTHRLHHAPLSPSHTLKFPLQHSQSPYLI